MKSNCLESFSFLQMSSESIKAIYSDWEFAYLYDVDRDEWFYAKMTGC